MLQTWIRCLPGHEGTCAPGAADWLLLLGAVVGLAAATNYVRKAIVVLHTLRATAWSPVLARRLSYLVKACSYREAEFFDADGAGEPWVARRRASLVRLAD